MNPLLAQALEPILRDLANAGLVAPRLEDEDWTETPGHTSVMMWAASGSGTGLSMALTAPRWEQVASVADQVQEWAIEDQLWGVAATNWPPCPEHPDRHPLEASTYDEVAVWICPTSRAAVTRIGSLGGADRPE